MKPESEAEINGKTYTYGMDVDRRSAKTLFLECLKREQLQQKDAENEKICKYYLTFCSTIEYGTAKDKRFQMHGKQPSKRKVQERLLKVFKVRNICWKNY